MTLKTLITFLRYNLIIIFANIFFYFLLAAVLVFLLISAIVIFNADSPVTSGTIYFLLIIPGILIIFYPSAFSIQIDTDTRMIETLFGIPNYRYKIWLVRLGLIFVIAFVLLLLLGILSKYVMADFPFWRMIAHLMVPLIFLSCISFMLATLTRSGAGTGTLLVILIIGFWMGYSSLQGSSWNLFHNPFGIPNESQAMVWDEITFYNRIYLLVGSILAVLYGLLNLQRREKYI
ncbi:hypothetical protein JXJ21_19810 [candidate division KSB1 bacterium]|nr:hypothetical protein [candidate division KSB1 bacterium]